MKRNKKAAGVNQTAYEKHSQINYISHQQKHTGYFNKNLLPTFAKEAKDVSF